MGMISDILQIIFKMPGDSKNSRVALLHAGAVCAETWRHRDMVHI